MSRQEYPRESFPVVHVDEIRAIAPDARWLIEGLWGQAAVGFVAGHPKSYKSWLGLDIALSVATGTPCLDVFPVRDPGRALIYLAEDSPEMVRERVAAIAAHRGVALADVDLHVITAPALRLDLAEHVARLEATVRAMRPRLLLLDPLVRLHGLDENRSGDIAGLLSHLRALQRACDVAVMVAHHTRKNEVGAGPAGQGLRGSGDLWAWSDSTLYIRRAKGKLRLSMEHRAAPAPDPVWLQLVDSDQTRLHLEVVTAEVEAEEQQSLSEAVVTQLSNAETLTRAELRTRLRIKNTRLGDTLVGLEREGRVARGPEGWRLARRDGPYVPSLPVRSDPLAGG